jgi:hypothetical protein
MGCTPEMIKCKNWNFSESEKKKIEALQQLHFNISMVPCKNAAALI